MKLTVIGCHGAYPDAGGATSGYLIEEGNVKVLLDCGSGVLAGLQRYCPLSELDAVILSHYHPDHCADLGCLQYAAMIETQLGKRTKPLFAWGPENIDTLSFLNYCTGCCYKENTAFQIDGLKFEVLQNIHEVVSYSIRVTSPKGAVLVYSGDTAYYEELNRFAARADCFLCEASFYSDGHAHTAQHLTSAEAAQLAEAAQAKLLVLTHLPHFGEPKQLISEAKAVFQGKTLLAEQWLEIFL